MPINDAGHRVICPRGVSDGSDGARPLWRSHSALTEMFFANVIQPWSGCAPFINYIETPAPTFLLSHLRRGAQLALLWFVVQYDSSNYWFFAWGQSVYAFGCPAILMGLLDYSTYLDTFDNTPHCLVLPRPPYFRRVEVLLWLHLHIPVCVRLFTLGVQVYLRQ